MFNAFRATKAVIILGLSIALPASALARPPHSHHGFTDGYTGHDAEAGQAALQRAMQGLRHGWPSGNYTPRGQI